VFYDTWRYILREGCFSFQDAAEQDRLLAETVVSPKWAEWHPWELSRVLNATSKKPTRYLATRVKQLDAADPKSVQAIVALGDALVSAAQQILPDKMLLWATLWPHLSAEDQCEICYKLCRYLKQLSDTPNETASGVLRPHWEADMLNQSADRVLPEKLGKLHFLTPFDSLPGGRKNRKLAATPNCLGIGLIMLAFFRLAGAKVYGMLPTKFKSQAVLPMLQRVREREQREFDQLGIAMPADDLENLEFTKEDLAAHKEAPSRPHIGVIVELSDSQYFFLDPYQDVATEELLQNSAQFRIPKLVLQQDSHPGIIVSVGDDGALSRKLKQVERKVSKTYSAIKKLHAEISDAKNFTQIWVLLGKSKYLWLLTEELNLSEEERNRLLAELELSGYVNGCDLFRCKETLDKRSDVAMCLLNFVSGHKLEELVLELRELIDGFEETGVFDFTRSNISSKDLESRFLELLKAFRAAAFELLALLPEMVLQDAFETGQDINLPHTNVEVGNGEYLMAVAIMSHVSCSLGFEEDVENVLATLSADQFRLLYAATKTFRVPKANRKQAEIAFSYLKERKYLLKSSEDACSKLNGRKPFKPLVQKTKALRLVSPKRAEKEGSIPWLCPQRKCKSRS